MGKPTILSKIAKEQGKSEEEVLADALGRSEGSIDGAAAILHAYPNTVRAELAKRGLQVVKEVTVRLEKVPTP